MPCAVVLINLGGPRTADEIGPFLREMLSDPALMKLGAVQPLLAAAIAWFRSGHARHRYAQMGEPGGGSPLLRCTLAQAAALQASLGSDFAVEVAMRYGTPSIETVTARLTSQGITRAVCVPLYPQRCAASTGTAQTAWNAAADTQGLETRWVDSFPTHPGYVRAVVDRVEEAIASIVSTGVTSDQIHVVFSAHGVPQRLIHAGDPYAAETQATVDAVMGTLRTKVGSSTLAWQSRFGPVRWLEPSTPSVLTDLARRGARHVVVVPISFVCDNIENVIEVDVELRALATQSGIATYRTAGSLNDHPAFIGALAELVGSAVSHA